MNLTETARRIARKVTGQEVVLEQEIREKAGKTAVKRTEMIWLNERRGHHARQPVKKAEVRNKGIVLATIFLSYSGTQLYGLRREIGQQSLYGCLRAPFQ